MKKTNTYHQGELLKNINSPEDLKSLKREQLSQLSSEIRQYIIDIVSERRVFWSESWRCRAFYCSSLRF